uniref:Uncharacterized protein n=1 Tax=Oryza meridionalis TaxID=40149 RepID=A0A0E0ECF9_9ORYZ
MWAVHGWTVYSFLSGLLVAVGSNPITTPFRSRCTAVRRRRRRPAPAVSLGSVSDSGQRVRHYHAQQRMLTDEVIDDTKRG